MRTLLLIATISLLLSGCVVHERLYAERERCIAFLDTTYCQTKPPTRETENEKDSIQNCKDEPQR